MLESAAGAEGLERPEGVSQVPGQGTASGALSGASGGAVGTGGVSQASGGVAGADGLLQGPGQGTASGGLSGASGGAVGTGGVSQASGGVAGTGGLSRVSTGAASPGGLAEAQGASAVGWAQGSGGASGPGESARAGMGAVFGDDWLVGRARRDGAWLGRGALSFLAEASDLLAGQLDEDLVAALTGQLIVPRLADWCAVWLEDETSGHGGWGASAWTGGARLARVWHASEHRIEELREALEQNPPGASDPPNAGPAPYPWPEKALDTPLAEPAGAPGVALAYRLVAGGRPLGTLVIGRGGIARFPDEITGLVEDLSRRVALAIGAARQYARQATISAVLQRGLLPGAVAEIPGVRSALVYEPCDKGGPSGDFYDLFPAGHGRWCFALGDVQGKGPEAAVVIGLARPWLRLLAREGYRVADVLDRLNQLLLDDATEAADAAARALV
ncbi:SpoIIE family protein phosphatase, partial [Streptomyces sp. 15-116A]|uniref:SpoIIE family protein phosphatase n=1 Tax=Streptomyces sp. 15-116A TaxID=2259035 RepID=UPI0037DA3835